MKGDYGAAAIDLASSGFTGHLAAVDTTLEHSLANRYDIRGFPPLKFFRRGQMLSEYNRSRKAADSVQFMKSPPIGEDEL